MTEMVCGSLDRRYSKARKDMAVVPHARRSQSEPEVRTLLRQVFLESVVTADCRPAQVRVNAPVIPKRRYGRCYSAACLSWPLPRRRGALLLSAKSAMRGAISARKREPLNTP